MNQAEMPLVSMTPCTNCDRIAVGTGANGLPYCHACRDWKADRLARIEKKRIAMTLNEVPL